MPDSKLMLHVGGRKATREEVFAVEAPPSTESWHPQPHRLVLTKVEEVLDAAGYTILRQEMALSHHGNRFFGVLDLESAIVPGVTLALGIRNSIDKSFPYGLAGGNRTFVCDNLALTGDLINIRRKHTKRGELRFAEATADAIHRLADFRQIEERRVRFMQVTYLDRHEGEAFLIKAFERGILSHRVLPEACRQFREPSHDWGCRGTLWHLYNAMTTPLQERAVSNPRSFTLATMSLMELLGPTRRLGFDGFAVEDVPELTSDPGTVIDVTPASV